MNMNEYYRTWGYIYCSVDPLECIFIALLASLMTLRHLKRRRFSSDEHTHVVIFEDILRKPVLICDSCVSYYDNYKMRQMLGVSKVITLDEYVGW